VSDGRTPTPLPVRPDYDPVDLKVASILYAGARRAYDYTPADERPERVEEEQAEEQ
jgi:hypothetical protein